MNRYFFKAKFLICTYICHRVIEILKMTMSVVLNNTKLYSLKCWQKY